MTIWSATARHSFIIPYQELLGNYDQLVQRNVIAAIIPYQELLGNYDCILIAVSSVMIIPYQELLVHEHNHTIECYYTIPRAIREL